MVHFEDHRLDPAVQGLKQLGVRYLRIGLSWADSFRPGAEEWFDRQMLALEPFDVTVTFCFTPEKRGLAPHHTRPPQVEEEFAEFCVRMIRRYYSGRRWLRAQSGSDGDLTALIGVRSDACFEQARELLTQLDGTDPILLRLMIVVAHPDDETIALGGQINRLRDALLLHVTDGAPRDGEDARHHGFAGGGDVDPDRAGPLRHHR